VCDVQGVLEAQALRVPAAALPLPEGESVALPLLQCVAVGLGEEEALWQALGEGEREGLCEGLGEGEPLPLLEAEAQALKLPEAVAQGEAERVGVGLSVPQGEGECEAAQDDHPPG
jgi:hypothetical protein